jgi:glycosyltransferase involved in cell wall biosynthesis
MKAFLVGQMEYLSKNGYKVTLICDTDEKFAKQLPDGIRYRAVRMKRGIDGIGSLISIYKLYKLFRSEKFDLIQYSTPNASLYTAIAAWLSRTPVRLYCQWGIRYVGFNGYKRIIFKALEAITCKLSTFIEPDSFSNLDFCHRQGLYSKKKSRVVWNGSANGVDLKKFNVKMKEEWGKKLRLKYKIDSNSIVFGFVGSVTRDKGINELLSAFRMVVNKNPRAVLLIVGEEEFINTIDDSLIEWSKSCSNIIYCGLVSEVQKYMASMDIFVLPSYREGFGSVIIEAEAMGVPVIVTDIDGPVNAMISNKTGLVVPKGDINSLYKAMVELMEDDKRRKTMGEEALIFAVSSFDKDVLWQKILEDREKLIIASSANSLHSSLEGEYNE